MVDLELGRLRLKTWSKSDFSIAETWPTQLYIYLRGGLGRVGLPPVLAPRMPVFFEDV